MTQQLSFDDAGLLATLDSLADEQLDALPYGVIAFDQEARARRYNRTEADAAAFPAQKVIGQHLFIELTPCMNNHRVGGRFDVAQLAGTSLGEVLPYVLAQRRGATG